jgi:hypothetical protein
MTKRTLAYLPSPTQSVWHLGPLPIHAYALCIVAGIFVALRVAANRWRTAGGREGDLWDVSGWAIVFGIIGGRLYHVISDPELYFKHGEHPLNAWTTYVPTAPSTTAASSDPDRITQRSEAIGAGQTLRRGTGRLPSSCMDLDGADRICGPAATEVRLRATQQRLSASVVSSRDREASTYPDHDNSAGAAQIGQPAR